jgi:fatty-acid desaturase
LVLLIINIKIALGGYILATFIERIRIGFFINYLLHSNFIGTYKVKETTNNSKNLVWLYPLTAGFSLHNQHHAEPTKLKEKSRWWEVDIEYWMCKLVTKP